MTSMTIKLGLEWFLNQKNMKPVLKPEWVEKNFYTKGNITLHGRSLSIFCWLSKKRNKTEIDSLPRKILEWLDAQRSDEKWKTHIRDVTK